MALGHGSKDIGRQPNYNLNRVAHEPWIACHICDFCIPRSESVRHYRKGKLVCQRCDDELTHSDYMEYIDRQFGPY